MEMTPEKAKEMLAAAIQAMLACGQFKVAHTAVMRTQAAGQTANVTCLLFGDSTEVLQAVAERAANPVISCEVEQVLMSLPPEMRTPETARALMPPGHRDF